MTRTERLWSSWNYFNTKYFGGKLRPPRVIRLTKATKYEGALGWRGTATEPLYGHPTVIHLSTYLGERKMHAALLHEMVHQYQYEVMKIPPEHDAEFRCYCKWIERNTKFKLR